MKRLFLICLFLYCFTQSASAAPIRWVDFSVPCESLKAAMDEDIKSFEQEKHVSWIDILAVAACRTGGRCPPDSVQRAIKDLRKDTSPQDSLGELYKYFDYYHESFSAVLGGLLGSYAIQKDDEWIPRYGLKAFSPIAEGYPYSHYDDFGADRSFGFKRKHLGNDLLGTAGTPIIAIEGGTIEALGWNRYGGWRVGIRSHDKKRYYYYAHLQKDTPYAPGLSVGQTVNAGDIIGFMGRTGYSDEENTNNIEIDHLHLGIQLIFDESQKDSDHEIWINVYPLVQLLNRHRCSIRETASGLKRRYPYRDLDLTSQVPPL